MVFASLRFPGQGLSNHCMNAENFDLISLMFLTSGSDVALHRRKIADLPCARTSLWRTAETPKAAQGPHCPVPHLESPELREVWWHVVVVQIGLDWNPILSPNLISLEANLSTMAAMAWQINPLQKPSTYFTEKSGMLLSPLLTNRRQSGSRNGSKFR